jgi:RNA recognition motif-containing protein
MLSSDDQIHKEFCPFGEIVDFRRPHNLAKRKPSQFAFIYYGSAEAVQAAIDSMDGKELWETRITVGDGDVQDSYFTQDTGR